MIQLDLARLSLFLELLPPEFRWTVELRHPSWQVPEVYDALGQRGGGFSDAELRPWAARVRALARSGNEVYVYFNNDREGHAAAGFATA